MPVYYKIGVVSLVVCWWSQWSECCWLDWHSSVIKQLKPSSFQSFLVSLVAKCYF